MKCEDIPGLSKRELNKDDVSKINCLISRYINIEGIENRIARSDLKTETLYAREVSYRDWREVLQWAKAAYHSKNLDFEDQVRLRRLLFVCELDRLFAPSASLSILAGKNPKSTGVFLLAIRERLRFPGTSGLAQGVPIIWVEQWFRLEHASNADATISLGQLLPWHNALSVREKCFLPIGAITRNSTSSRIIPWFRKHVERYYLEKNCRVKLVVSSHEVEPGLIQELMHAEVDDLHQCASQYNNKLGI